MIKEKVFDNKEKMNLELFKYHNLHTVILRDANDNSKHIVNGLEQLHGILTLVKNTVFYLWSIEDENGDLILYENIISNQMKIEFKEGVFHFGYGGNELKLFAEWEGWKFSTVPYISSSKMFFDGNHYSETKLTSSFSLNSPGQRYTVRREFEGGDKSAEFIIDVDRNQVQITEWK